MESPLRIGFRVWVTVTVRILRYVVVSSMDDCAVYIMARRWDRM